MVGSRYIFLGRIVEFSIESPVGARVCIAGQFVVKHATGRCINTECSQYQLEKSFDIAIPGRRTRRAGLELLRFRKTLLELLHNEN